MKDEYTGFPTAKTTLEASFSCMTVKRLEVKAIFAVLIVSCSFHLRFITYHGTPITTSSVWWYRLLLNAKWVYNWNYIKIALNVPFINCNQRWLQLITSKLMTMEIVWSTFTWKRRVIRKNALIVLLKDLTEGFQGSVRAKMSIYYNNNWASVLFKNIFYNQSVSHNLNQRHGQNTMNSWLWKTMRLSLLKSDC